MSQGDGEGTLETGRGAAPPTEAASSGSKRPGHSRASKGRRPHLHRPAPATRARTEGKSGLGRPIPASNGDRYPRGGEPWCWVLAEAPLGDTGRCGERGAPPPARSAEQMGSQWVPGVLSPCHPGPQQGLPHLAPIRQPRRGRLRGSRRGSSPRAPR